MIECQNCSKRFHVEAVGGLWFCCRQCAIEWLITTPLTDDDLTIPGWTIALTMADDIRKQIEVCNTEQVK